MSIRSENIGGTTTSGGGSNTDGTILAVTQPHSFSVGEVVTNDGGSWVLADSSDADLLGIGIVESITGGTAFVVRFIGSITTLSGLTTDEYYFVDPSTPGALTATEPTSSDEYSNPILLATSATAGIVLPMRPSGAIDGAFGVDAQFFDTVYTSNEADANGGAF